MQYILDFIDTMTDAEVLNYAATNNITIIEQFDAFGQVYLGECNVEPTLDTFLLSCINNDNSPVNLMSVNLDLIDNIQYKEFDINEDENWWKVASIDEMDFEEAVYRHSIRGSICNVYIMDSGIFEAHPQFANASVELLHSFTDDFIDRSGHGTAMASLISGETCALTSTNLKILKIFDENVATYQSDLLAALNAVILNYEANGKPSSIVNLSWSIPFNEYINNKIQYMIDSGIYVVASAGNNGLPIADVTPACIPDVITVGSIGQDLLPSDFSAYTTPSFTSYTDGETNFGQLDGWAPGEQIWAAKTDGTLGWVAGTSPAAAIVSSAVAYNLSLYQQVEKLDLTSLRADDLESRSVLVKNIVFKRQGLITLTEQYSGSTSGIVTLNSSGLLLNGKNIHNVRAGTLYKTSYASPDVYTNVSTADDMPEHVTLGTDGYLTIDYPEISDSYIILPTINFVITKKSGEILYNAVTLIIYRHDQTYAEVIDQAGLIENDPLIEFIKLAVCTDGGVCDGTCDPGKICQGDKNACSCV